MSCSKERFEADLARLAAQSPNLHLPGDCVACVRQMVAVVRCIAEGDEPVHSANDMPVAEAVASPGSADTSAGGLTVEQQRSFLFVERLFQLLSELTAPARADSCRDEATAKPSSQSQR
jgi:hypothetical protein